MTEEIIIDGVNVAGCDFYNDCGCSAQEQYAEGEFLWAEKCEECPNCYYKQLKRLEQENFALTQESQQKSQTICDLYQENKALKDNNNHLQAIIDDGRVENKRFREENRELKAYKDVNEDFKKAWDELNKKYTEVLKLAKTNADSNEYCLQELEKENKELKEKLDKEEYNVCCECTNIQNQNDSYRSALEEIRDMFLNQVAWVGQLTNFEEEIYNKINEVSQCE